MTASSKASILRSRVAHARIADLDLAPARAMPGVKAVDLAARRRQDRALCRRADRRGRGDGPQDRASRARRHQDHDAKRCRRRSASTPRASPMRRSCSIGPQEEGRQRLRRDGRARRRGRGTSAARRRPSRKKPKKARQLGRRRARRARSAAGRRHVPHRHAAAHLPRAACRSGAFRRRRSDGACLDASGVSPQGADRQALQARPRQGARDRRPCRRRLRLEGQRSAWRRSPRSSWRARRKAPVRVAFDRHEELSVTGYRPAAEMKVSLLPARDGELKALSLDAYADTGAAINSTIAGLARLIYPAEAKAARRFRRRQQPAARRAVPRSRRTADGVRAGAGGRRGRAAAEARSDRAAQALGSQSQPPAAL